MKCHLSLGLDISTGIGLAEFEAPFIGRRILS